MHNKRKRDQRKKPEKVKSLVAKTENQKEYIRSVIENPVTICIGPAGTGKSFVAAGICAEHLHRKQTDQVIITRPIVCAGKDIGSLPGELSDKIQPYLLPMEENLKFFLGQSQYGHYKNKQQIRFEPLETMRGATFHNAYMILDEAQNCTLDQIKMFLTRMGEGSKAIINGDVKQTDIHSMSGLQTCVDKLAAIEGVGAITLTYEDIQRHGIIGKILTALES